MSAGRAEFEELVGGFADEVAQRQDAAQQLDKHRVIQRRNKYKVRGVGEGYAGGVLFVWECGMWRVDQLAF